jgi:hypothetical protein
MMKADTHENRVSHNHLVIPAGGPGLDSETGDSCTTQENTTMTYPGACATVVRFSPARFTGKERDTEYGKEYFEARYYGSSMGRNGTETGGPCLAFET